MEANWDSVPSKFQYLDNSVLQDRSNDLLIVPWIDSLRRPVPLCERTALGLENGLSAAELSELARVYDEILKREDNLAVLEWCVSADNKESQVAASMIGRLLTLLRELGEFGIAPFAGHLIQCQLLPTYRNLPANLGYLREAIDRYCSDLPSGREDGPVSQGMYFLRKTARFFTGERRRLRELGERIENDRQAICDWYRKHQRTPEAGKWLDLENVLMAAGFLRDDL